MRRRRKARLKGMVCFVWAGWQEVLKTLWCLFVGFVWRSVSIRLLSRWTCKSKKERLWCEEFEYSCVTHRWRSTSHFYALIGQNLRSEFMLKTYAASGNLFTDCVISLLWQLRWYCNPDHNKFLSLSNTTVVATFPNLCFWRRSLCSNLGGIYPPKLYRATLIALIQYSGRSKHVRAFLAQQIIELTTFVNVFMKRIRQFGTFQSDQSAHKYVVCKVIMGF